MVLRTIYGFMIISFFANSIVASTLHQAVLSNDIVAVSNFIRSGVDINKRDGKTPLHYACLNGNLQIAEILVSHGADVNARDATGMTPLHCLLSTYRDDDSFAAKVAEGEIEQIRHSEKILFLLQNAKVRWDVQDNKGNYPVHLVKSESAVVALQKLKENIDRQNTSGKTLLMISCQEKNESVVRKLLLYNANIHLEDRDGNTALMYSLMGDYDKGRIPQLLINLGARVAHKDKYGNTPLHWAVRSPSKYLFNIVLALIERGADLNAIGSMGAPLHGVLDDRVCELLLSRGAKMDLKAKIHVWGTPISPLEYWTMLGLNTRLRIAQRYSK